MSTATLTPTAHRAPRPVRPPPTRAGSGCAPTCGTSARWPAATPLQIKQDPESMFDALLMPIIFTLLFVYVFGGAIGAARAAGRTTSTTWSPA